MPKKKIEQEIREAIKDGDLQMVAALIESDKTRLTMMTVYGTWLHVAASLGKLEVVKQLVAMGADIDRKGGIFGAGPLKEAASNGHIDVVEYLLDRGAKMDVSEPERNPLFATIDGGHVAVAKLLIDRGIDTQIQYNGDYMKQMDALAFAREWGQDEIVGILMSLKKD